MQSLEVPRTPSCPSPVTSLPPPLALGNLGMALNILILDESLPALPFLASVFIFAVRSWRGTQAPIVDWWHVSTKLAWVLFPGYLSWAAATGSDVHR